MVIYYNPNQLEIMPVLSPQVREELDKLNERYHLTTFLNSSRNIEELGIEFIHSSSQIEGNTYTQAETETLLKAGITAGGKKYSDAIMLLNQRKAYDKTILGRYEESYDGLLDMHYDLMEVLLENNQRGIVRNQEVTIGHSEYLPLNNPEDLVQEMKYMLRQYHDIKDPYSKAIYAHLNIAYLQFFTDGNKRTARMFQNNSLIKSGVMPLLFDSSRIGAYKNAILEYYETGSVSYYVQWFIESYKHMYRKLGVEQPQLPKRGKSISENLNTEDK